jgi:hypothetical protein
LKTFAREHGLSLLLFHGGHLSTYCFRYLDTYSFFPILFFLHSHISLSAILEKFQEIHLHELGAFIPNIFMYSPNVVVKHFGGWKTCDCVLPM